VTLGSGKAVPIHAIITNDNIRMIRLAPMCDFLPYFVFFISMLVVAQYFMIDGRHK